jgi:hypothetical protein
MSRIGYLYAGVKDTPKINHTEEHQGEQGPNQRKLQECGAFLFRVLLPGK